MPIAWCSIAWGAALARYCVGYVGGDLNGLAMTDQPGSNGIANVVTKVTPRSVADTVARLTSLAEAKG